MRDQILEILTDIRPDIDFEKETKLIDDKILESFDIITIVGELNDAFDIEIGPKELIAENFNSLDALTEMVDELVNG
jgi:acyl carrier protein